MSEAIQEAQPDYRTPARPDLRHGVWTRLGDHSVLGDEVTEALLGKLAERTRSAAKAQGYAVGWSEGHQAGLRRAAAEAAVAREEAERAEEQRAQEHAAAVAGLVAAATMLREASQEVAAQIADQATTLALEVTETLIGHELAVAADPSADVVKRVLAMLPDEPAVLVRLHPETAVATPAAELTGLGVTVRPDAGLDRHDAVIETDTTAVDLRVGTVLKRLREALREDES